MWLLLLNRPDLNYTTADEELCFDYKFFSTRSFAAEFLKILRPLQLAPSFTRFGLQNAGRRALLQTSPLFFTKSSYIPSSKKSDGLATRTFVRSFLRLADVNYKKQDQKLCSRHTSFWILPKIFRPARENLAAWHLEPSSAPLFS